MSGTTAEAAPLDSQQCSSRGVRRARWAFVGAALLFAGTTVFLLRQPLPWLAGVVADDAFYYLQIATHVVHGRGSTFDGVNPTNGYHPLWMLLTVACAALVDDKAVLLRAVLAVGFALHFVAALLLTRPLTALVGGCAAWIMATVWLLNPFAQLLVLQGLEASLFMLALILVLDVYVARVEPLLGAPCSSGWIRAAAYFGAAIGLACLARTEAIIAGGLAIGLAAVTLWRNGARAVAALRYATVAASAASVVVAPWLVFSWVTVGGLGQDSGAMKLLWGAEQFAAQGLLFRAHYTLFYLVRVWLEMPLGLSLVVPRSGLVTMIVLPTLALAILVHRKRPGAETLARLTTGLVVLVLATGSCYGAVMGDPQIWHLVQPAIGSFLLVGLWAVQVARSHPSLVTASRMRWSVLAVVAIAGGLHLRATLLTDGRYPWQRDVYTSQPAFEALVPADQAIGAFNAGMPGYFGGRRIVNLDGLVNHAVVGYWKRGDFTGYLREAGIRYVLDEPTGLERALRFSRTPLPREPLHQVPLTAWRRERVLWRIQTP